MPHKLPLMIQKQSRVLLRLICACMMLWATGSTADAQKNLNVLAFGSCNHSHLAQPHWANIESHQPDLFLWTGDVVYADTTDAAEMRRKYQLQLNVPEYRRFQSIVPIVGVWDDHDYGINNGGKGNPVKAAAQQIFLDFIDEPNNTARRTQQGVYTSYTYGVGNHSVKLFLLDTRYHRDRTGSGRADMLGKQQWQWLEKEIRGSEAAVNLFVSSVSVMSPQFPFAEEWNDFKWSRKKLFKLMSKHDLPGVLFLTGDRHFSSHLEGKVKGKTFHEFMSSGLTHYMHRKRVSRVFRHVYGDENSYFGKNFSKITFHWNQRPLKLSFEVFDTENQRQVEKSLTLINGAWSG